MAMVRWGLRTSKRRIWGSANERGGSERRNDASGGWRTEVGAQDFETTHLVTSKRRLWGLEKGGGRCG
jgi:hypothetical protein